VLQNSYRTFITCVTLHQLSGRENRPTCPRPNEMLQASSACRPATRQRGVWQIRVWQLCSAVPVWHAQSEQHEAVARDGLVLEAMGVEKPPNPNLPHPSLQRAAWPVPIE
jgi:hypothetical protein